jgi:hypothetical protein
MAQNCFASISSTGLHCAWCITRQISENGVELDQAFCENHNKPCKDLGYYCGDFIGYRPDYRLTDEEEQQIISNLRNKKGE